MSQPITLDVFGTRMLAVSTEQGWEMSILGDEGKRRPVRDLVIPEHIKDGQELVSYLSDLYHESATPERPSVVQLDGSPVTAGLLWVKGSWIGRVLVGVVTRTVTSLRIPAYPVSLPTGLPAIRVNPGGAG